jgi:large subunit ribosomal protein L4
MKLPVHRTSGRNSNITVRDGVWNAPANEQLLAQAVRVYRFNQRQGSSKAQNRSEVTRTTRKWYRQKGTGNARHGARSAPIFVGGGVTHGPRGNRDWSRKLTQRQAHRALVSALSMQHENILISADLNELDGKTKSAQAILDEIVPEGGRLLIVLDHDNDNFEKTIRSLRNIPTVRIVTARQLTTFDVAEADTLIFTQEAVEQLEARLESIADAVEAKLEAAKATKTAKASKSDTTTEKKTKSKKS